MDCSSCHLSYTLTDRRPKVLPCSHELCAECVTRLSQSGEITCPIDQNVYTVNDREQFPEIKHLIQGLQTARLHCTYHLDAEASVFCPTHFLALCDHCLSRDGCDKLDVYGESEALKFALCKAAEELNTDRVPQTLKQRIRDKFRLPAQELLDLCRELKSIESQHRCIKCMSPSFDYVNLSDMCLYCTQCYHDSINKDSDSIEQFVLFNEDCRTSINWLLSTKLQKIDFCELSLSNYHWMFYPPEDLLKFFDGAKEIIKLENRPRNTEKTLPAFFLCPNCKGMSYHDQHRFRRLPCREAFHALCDNPCAQASSTDVTCPLDNRVYHIPYTELPLFSCSNCSGTTCGEEGREEPPPVMAPVIPMDSAVIRPDPHRRIVGRGMTLSDKGIPIPPFQPPQVDFLCVPVYNLRAADRFLAVLPPESPIPGLNTEEKTFTEPWFINYFDNQVEALSFRSFDNAMLWGLGIANPIAPGARAVVLWVRLYEGEKAAGPGYTDMRLINRDLVGGNGVITDVYFESPYSLRILQFVTLKVKIVSVESVDRLAVYHGNHIGRYEDIVGTDELLWETCPTFSVEEDERNSGQQHFIGPLLRLIYQR